MMQSTLKLHLTQNKSLLFATIISLVLHTLLLTNTSISLPSDIDSPSSINVRLAQVLPEKKSATPHIKKTQTTSKKALNNNTKPLSNTDEAVAQLDSENTTNHQPALSDPNETTATNAIDDNNLVAESSNENTPMSEQSSSTDTHLNAAYTYIETLFEVTRGDESGVLGLTQIIFNMDLRKNSYQLTSITEPKGLASLFLGKLEQYSEGYASEKGLRPNYYAYKYASNGDKSQYANLLWSDGIIEMTSKKGKISAPLPENTQDFLSFMYQFMFTPPLNVMQITMTNGKYLRTYSYSFEGEESITTKLGPLKALHLLKTGNSQEKTEIWLALDYQNIPIKIRKTEKNGDVIEQTVTSISTTRPE